MTAEDAAARMSVVVDRNRPAAERVEAAQALHDYWSHGRNSPQYYFAVSDEQAKALFLDEGQPLWPRVIVASHLGMKINDREVQAATAKILSSDAGAEAKQAFIYSVYRASDYTGGPFSFAPRWTEDVRKAFLQLAISEPETEAEAFNRWWAAALLRYPNVSSPEAEAVAVNWLEHADEVGPNDVYHALLTLTYRKQDSGGLAEHPELIRPHLTSEYGDIADLARRLLDQPATDQ